MAAAAGQQLPLGLFHHPLLQHLGGVAGQDLHRLLQQNGAAVALLVDKVHGGTGHLAAPGQSSLMGAQAVHAGPAEGRDERRVNIQDAARMRPR